MHDSLQSVTYSWWRRNVLAAPGVYI